MSSAAIAFDDFSFSYPNYNSKKNPLIGPFSFEIPEGSFTILTGKTGCGKTTLLKSCKPELTPCGTKHGAITIFGNTTDCLTTEESAHLIGYVSQNADNQLICSEVWHELAFGLENVGTNQKLMRRRVAELAHFFGMNSWLHQSVPTLSGGQKQLLVLASTLALEPRILLLDEPTSQLDPVAAHSFLHALFRVNRELGITVVVATHSPELMVPYATNNLELEDGLLNEKPLAKAAGLEKQETFARTNGKAHIQKTPIKANSAEAMLPTPPNANSQKRFFSRTSNAETPTSSYLNTSTPTVITVKNASFRYSKKEPFVLRDCSLSIKQGTLHAVVGANACGKSTLLSLIAGTLKPERGKIKNKLAASQGFIPQDPKALFVCDSVLEELQEWQNSVGYSDKEIQTILEELDLFSCAHQHPYDLSGGQAQLLAFAKVLLTKPQLLLLDEATKGLDAKTKVIVASLCKSLTKKGTTILLVTHDLEFAWCIADETTMLFDGMDACTEPARVFFANNLFYKPQPTEFTHLWNASCHKINYEQSPTEKGSSIQSQAQTDTQSKASMPASHTTTQRRIES